MILLLTDDRATDVRRAGGKGASLARLAARGHRVPDGFVVPTEVFAALARSIELAQALAPHLDTSRPLDEDALARTVSDLQDRIATAPLSPELERAVAEAVAAADASLGSPSRWAVRSSAVAEDSAEASFAGQYATVLGVVGADAVMAAIRHCFGSFLDAHALVYRRSRGLTDLDAAVVVQRLVQATAAGVCFSVDPVRNDPQTIVVDANYGLGESVVSGVVSPDTFRLSRADLELLSLRIGGKEVRTDVVDGRSQTLPTALALRDVRCIDDRAVRAVAELALAVEREEGHPVDIEWALEVDTLHLLQARPITTVLDASGVVRKVTAGFRAELDTPIDPAYPLYSNGNISEVLPGCITPLAFSLVAPVIDHSFRAQLRETGAMEDDHPGLRIVGFFFHRPYLCVSYLAEAARRSPGISPDRVYEEFVGKVEVPTPAFSREDFTFSGLRRLLRAIRTMVRRRGSIDADARAAIARTIDAHRNTTDIALDAMDDRLLADDLRFAPERVEVSVLHVWASTFAVASFGLLRELTASWLGDRTGALASRLVTGAGSMPSADPAFGLYELARVLLDEPELRARLDAARDDGAALAALTDPSTGPTQRFAAALAGFLAEHGHRAVCEAEPRLPSWREDPTQVIALVRNYLDPRLEPPSAMRARQEHVRAATAAEAFGRLGLLRRTILRQVEASCLRFLPLREQLKNAIVLRADRQRRVIRAIARRLVERGQLATTDDAYFLLEPELGALLTGSLAADEAERRILRRRDDMAICGTLNVPKLQDGVPRSVAELPLPRGDVLFGLGVSPGRVEGRARVVLDPRRDAHVEPGEILVAPVTDAGWTPLFVNAAALVVDVGGLLSHGSVVAREYGLTAVVGVSGATRRIRTGDRLVVDGDEGKVVLLDPAD